MILELLMSLSINDYKDLAKAVQVEAAIGTADEYCVAASILNRVMSDKFPNTVSAVIYAPMQKSWDSAILRSYITVMLWKLWKRPCR